MRITRRKRSVQACDSKQQAGRTELYRRDVLEADCVNGADDVGDLYYEDNDIGQLYDEARAGNPAIDDIGEMYDDDRDRIIAADLDSDRAYIQDLGVLVVDLLDDAGYFANYAIDDQGNYLLIEIHPDEGGEPYRYMQPISEIVPDWDDLDADAEELTSAVLRTVSGPAGNVLPE